MPKMLQLALACAWPLLVVGVALAATDEVPLPAGVRAVWDLSKAYSERTPARERVCLNGLWRWQPASTAVNSVPQDDWGYFKVPGPWPGITDYLQKDCQTLFRHPAWASVGLQDVEAAWYQRQITVPAGWTGRRISLSAEYVNSLATVFVDGRNAGEIRFPGGEVDLTPLCRPGATHLLSIHVVALPLQAVMLSYTDTASARQVRGTVQRRGLCGDVWLVGAPRGARIVDVRVETSVRRGEISFDAALEGLTPRVSYVLRATITAPGGSVVRRVTGRPFQVKDLKNGRITFAGKWMPTQLWDLNTPGNTLTAQIALLNASGKALDVGLPIRFGFREFWIQGRDFYLNGSRIFLSAVQYQNAQVGAAWASYRGARESMERLKSFGINFIYMGNYGCEPGSHLSFSEILRAADDVGMLVALSQPHFSHYDWKAPDADATNGYARHAEFYVRVAQNHPSVVAYAMSHNATGYVEDMNPDRIDGLQEARDTWSLNNSRLALRAEAIVRRLDPSRIVYHHSSGNLGAMHTSNFYINFAPIQEVSDWFEHWATVGAKPLFLCEYGVPFSWDWSMYRGWYNGKREWGSAVVPWEFCLAEWDAQFLGDGAYRISERDKANLRWEAAQFRAGALWHRWDYPTPLGSGAFEERNPIFASYITDNWRAFRTWGVSAISPWEHAAFWLLRDGVTQSRKPLVVDWERLQRPGFSADYVDEQPDDMVLAYARSDWTPTAAGRAVIRNNGPLLAYIGGKPARFTSKDHNFTPGEAWEKQLILINNSRTTVEAICRWTLGLPRAVSSAKRIFIPTGQQVRIPLRFALPRDLPPGRYELNAAVRFVAAKPGATASLVIEPWTLQTDSLWVNVLPPPPPVPQSASIAVFDPKGETTRLLRGMGVQCQAIAADADLSPYQMLVIGRGALTPDGPAPALQRVRQGLKVIVFEQTSQALEQRLGFRVEEYGLRQVFPRLAGHPALAGLDAEALRDWRGDATLLPPRLEYTIGERIAPMVKWCGIDVTRVWRCGCRGNVASVLIEKPARGDFTPILDGGYSLQYSPLLEYREGAGMVLFCQMDVTGRTEADPAAYRLVRNILNYVAAWRPRQRRQLVYAGEPAGRDHLAAAGFAPEAYGSGALPADGVLVVGPAGAQQLAPDAETVRQWLRNGGRLLAAGLGEADVNALSPSPVRMRLSEHIATTFPLPSASSWLAGVSPADVHNRDPRTVPLVVNGADVVGDGVLAATTDGALVLCQAAPWQFGNTKQMNLKRTFRRFSFTLTRLLSNMGVQSATPLLDRFGSPARSGTEQRWLQGLYLDTPEEWDDPYRFFCW